MQIYNDKTGWVSRDRCTSYVFDCAEGNCLATSSSSRRALCHHTKFGFWFRCAAEPKDEHFADKKENREGSFHREIRDAVQKAHAGAFVRRQ